jgi:predicted MFS family arabinose efflux permease
VLTLVRLVDETTGFLPSASVERFRDDVGIDYRVAGAIFLAYGIGGIAGGVAVAATDGRSRRAVTVGGALVLAAAMALFGAATAAPVLLVAAFVEAAGATCLVHGGEITLANDLAARGEGHRLERVLARTNLWAVAGDVAGPLVLALARAAGVGWRETFLAAAALVALYGVVLARVRFPAPVDAPADGAGAEPVAVTRQVTVWLLGAAAFATMPLDESYLAAVLAFAEDVRGVDPALVALLGVAFVAGGAVAFTSLADVVAGTPLPTLLWTTGLGMSSVMLVAAFAPAWALVPVGLVQSCLLAMTWLGLQVMVLRANPGREGRTKLLVEVTEASSFGIVVVLGVVADRAGLRDALVGFALVPLLLLPVSRALRRRWPQDSSQTTSVSRPSARS